MQGIKLTPLKTLSYASGRPEIVEGNEMKHTQGPWHFDAPESSGMPIIHVYAQDNKGFMHHSRTEDELWANCRLIASAPELLDALKEARDRCYNSFEPDNQSACYYRWSELINKAEGKS